MESIKKFKEIIKPKLEALEAFRQVQYTFYKVAYLSYILPVLLFGGMAYAINIKSHLLFWPCMILGALSIKWVDIYLLGYFRKKYVKSFKANILYDFINVVYPRTNFDSKRMVDVELFKQSQLYGTEFISYEGEDYFEGTTELGTKYQFSEIRTSYSNNNKHNKGIESFEGVFYVLEVPNLYSSGVKIFSKKDTPSWYRGSTEIGNLTNVQIGRISPSFNKICDVYNVEKGEGERLLNKKIIDASEKIIKDWSNIFRISFYDNRIFLCLKSEDLFNAKISVSINEEQFIERIYREIRKSFSVVESISNAFETIDKSLFIDKKEPKPEKLTDLDDNLYDHLIDF